MEVYNITNSASSEEVKYTINSSANAALLVRSERLCAKSNSIRSRRGLMCASRYFSHVSRGPFTQPLT